LSSVLGGLFRRSRDLESFDRAVRALGGDFSFDAEAMIDLGTAYFERYPDRAQGRDLEAVRIGYALARICLIEKAVDGLSAPGREFFRTVFRDPALATALVRARRSRSSREELRGDARRLTASLDALRAAIDEIPKGMIKERFAGGISHLCNVIYIVRTALEKGPGTD
jgi:hypothetical protein